MSESEPAKTIPVADDDQLSFRYDARLAGKIEAQWQERWDTADYKGKRDLLKMALRGKHLVIQPAQRGRGSADQTDIVRRITIE